MAVNRDTLLKQIRDAGVIGAGGAGFPTYKKLESQVEHVIANGAECEPLLQKDRETMLQEPRRLLSRAGDHARADRRAGVTIAVKHKNQDMVDGFRRPDRGQRLPVLRLRRRLSGGRRILPGLRGHGTADSARRDSRSGRLPGRQRGNDRQRGACGRRAARHDKYLTITGAVAKPITTARADRDAHPGLPELAGGCTVDDPVILVSGVMMGGVTREPAAARCPRPRPA